MPLFFPPLLANTRKVAWKAAFPTAEQSVPPPAASKLFLQDTFTAPDGRLLDSHMGESGAGWMSSTGSGMEIPEIGGGRVFNGTQATALSANLVTPPGPDYEVTAVWDRLTAIANERAGLIIRAQDYQSGYVLNYGSDWGLFRAQGGTLTRIGAALADNFPAGSSRTAKLKAVGATITAEIVGVGTITVTDTTFPDAGKITLRTLARRSATTGMHLTSIEAMDLTA